MRNFYSIKKQVNIFRSSVLLLLIAPLFSLNINAQCPSGNVTLTTQAQVNQFIVDYPNCTEIAGFLRIDGAGGTNITNLTGLTNIEKVHGYFRVVDNQSLQNLDGLNNLNQIDGLLTIGANAILTNVNGLSNLNSVGGYLAVQANPQLQNLNGLANLSQVGQDIFISSNTVLSNISALQNTTFVPSSGYGLTITSNPVLSICNLPNFCIYLANPAGTHPRNITGNVGDCISEQSVTNKCNECPLGSVELNTQAQVNQFIINYPNCTIINGNLTIRGADIVNLNGLSNIVEVTGYLGVYDNIQLQNFTGLGNLTIIGVSLDVSNNPGLLNTNGLSGLTNVGTEIQFYNNPQLQNISSLNGITGIGGGIWIIENPQLQSLSGLQNILQVGGDIDISGNTILNNITALQNINPSSITPDGTYGLTIKDNPAVSVCNLPNFCAYLANAAATHPRDITGNAGDCLTEQTVISACILSLDEFDATSLNAYPNPVADILNITYNKNIEKVSVVNVFGQEVVSKTVNSTSTQLDMSTLPAGNYFIKVMLDGMVKTVKVLKQ